MEDSGPDYCSRSSLIKCSGSKPLSISASACESSITSSPGVKLWHYALKKVRSSAKSLDPWNDFNLDAVPTMEAIRHRYSALKKKWIRDTIFIKVEEKAFNRGAMRECFRLKKVPENGDWRSASNYVAKRYLSPVQSSVYLDDVRLQMEAKLWSEAFNKQNPPKKVDVFQMSVIEVLHEVTNNPPPNGDAKRRGSIAMMNALPQQCKAAPPSCFYHIERYMEGEYRKYNSNSGFVANILRNTPQAFSHFTFERSGHRILVVDIQGVGDLYTDPQIHTSDGVGYNEGNLGLRGMALFFHSHRCNPLCDFLGLTPFDLSVNEVAELFEGSISIEDISQQQDDQGQDDDDAGNAEDVFGSISPPPIYNLRQPPQHQHVPQSLHLSVRPKKNPASATNCGSLFPLSKRSLSLNTVPQAGGNGSALSTCYRSNSKHLYGPTVSRDEEFRLFTPSRSPISQPMSAMKPRMHIFSGSAPMGAMAEAKAPHPFSAQGLRSGSMEDSVEWEGEEMEGGAEMSSSREAVHFEVDSVFSLEEEPAIGELLGCRPHTRRTRNMSEPSGVGFVEFSGTSTFTGATQQQQHLQSSHDVQKPTSAAYPSNLDQEIGQSTLGQLHHELARLHEAGRFVKRPCGGWSQNGLGGLDEVDGARQQLPGEQGESGQQYSVDWESVLFHEKLSAQLGCLEALIIMAHYYLGLPTQLLSDCPIKPSEDELSLGVDYLWRSSEGGDRRCMILLARYLDASVIFDAPAPGPLNSLVDRAHLRAVLHLRITPPEDFLVLVAAHTNGFPVPTASSSATDRRPWVEAADLYRKAIHIAGRSVPGSSAPPEGESGAEANGADAEGRYDAAEDLSPVHRLLARLAEMYEVGGHGLEADFKMASALYAEAGESATQMANGRLAGRYFELSDEAYARIEEPETKNETGENA